MDPRSASPRNAAVLVGTAEEASATVDDVCLPVVEARDQDHGRREADDDSAVGIASHVSQLELPEVHSGDHVADGVERHFITGESIRHEWVRLRERADVRHAHRRGFEAIESLDLIDDERQIQDLLVRLRQCGSGARSIAVDQHRHSERDDHRAGEDRPEFATVESVFHFHVTLLTNSAMLRGTRSDSRKLPSPLDFAWRLPQQTPISRRNRHCLAT